MRTMSRACDLKVGDLAFLPFWGKLMKAKIIAISAVLQTKSGERITVHYEVLSEPIHRLRRPGNLYIMDVNSVYEVYTRPARM